MYSFFDMTYDQMVVSDIPAKLNAMWCVADIHSEDLPDDLISQVISSKSDIHIQYNVCDGTPIYMVERIPRELLQEDNIAYLERMSPQTASISISEEYVDISILSGVAYESIK